MAVAAAEQGTFDVLLYHHDGAPPNKAQSVIDRMKTEWDARETKEPLVAVVPMRETEAWLLADEEALRRTLRVRRLPAHPAAGEQVESLSDPKQDFRTLVREVAGPKATRNHGIRDYYARLAETVRIDGLRQVPAFQQWWDDMIEALDGLGYEHG